MEVSNEKKNEPTIETLDRFGRNKVIPKLLREEILLSLSFYPELLATSVKFTIIDPAIRSSVMQAQPELKTMFNGKGQRGYVIRISRYFRGDDVSLPIEDIPQNILIGWIGHELGHVMDYLDRNALKMARFGIGYSFSRKYLMQAERRADLFAISHGLGGNIVATKNFILDHAHLPERYKAKIRRLYLSPEETMLLIAEYKEQV